MKSRIIKLNLFFLLLATISFLNQVVAQEPTAEFNAQLNPSYYAGGYNISCNGSNNGSINVFITGGLPPFTFAWLDGSTARNRTDLPAGYYQVIISSSNGQSIIREIILTEPEIFAVDLVAEETTAGYHLRENGGNTGVISSIVRGGVPPYTYLWSNGSIAAGIENLTAGTYSVVIHDATNCITNASTTLIEPTPLHFVSMTSPKVVGNYNISCSITGSISVQVAGDTPPYIYNWLHGDTTQNVVNLMDPGLYKVFVTDSNGAQIASTLTLTKSPNLIAEAQPFVYQNGKNTSCYTCSNGSINVTINSGTAP